MLIRASLYAKLKARHIQNHMMCDSLNMKYADLVNTTWRQQVDWWSPEVAGMESDCLMARGFLLG